MIFSQDRNQLGTPGGGENFYEMKPKFFTYDQ